MKKTILIPEVNQPKFEAQMNKLVKLSKKLGSGEVSYKKTDSRLQEYNKKMLMYLEYEITGEAPTLNGYRLVAILERQASLNLVYPMDSETHLPEGLAERKPFCEHCNSNRQRKHLFILQNEETGEFVQVGKTCVKDFTGGHQNPEWVAGWYAYLKELEEVQHDNISGMHLEFHHRVLDVIAFSAYYTDKEGYIKTADSTEENPSTARKVKLAVTKDDSELKELGYYEKAKRVIEWGVEKEAVGYGYFSNLKTLMRESHTHSKNIGILASAYSVYMRELVKAKTEEVENKTKEESPESKFIGEIGDKGIYELTYNREVTFSTEYGWMNIYFFTDEFQNVFIWKTSKVLDAEVGAKLKIKGTTKDHSEYNGIKQNVLTRCKVVE